MTMLAISQLSPAAQIERVWSVLRTYHAPAAPPRVRYFETREAVLFFGMELVPASSLLDGERASELLSTYFAEGRQWVRIAGMGYLSSHEYVCTIDRSRETASKATAMEIAGPPLDENERTISTARVLVGFLEAVSQRLTLTGNAGLAEKVLALYGERNAGRWQNECLENWSLVDVCNLGTAIERICLPNANSTTGAAPFVGSITNVRRIQNGIRHLLA